MYKDVVIVGHEGYVGKSLYRYLGNKEEYNITGFDKKSSIDEKGIQDSNHSLSFPDVIVFLAAHPGAAACLKNPKAAIRDNITAPIWTIYEEFLTFAADSIFIFASSLGVRDWQQNFYTTTKYMVEQEMMRIADDYDADVRILRFANIYGGPDYLKMKNSVISKFAKNKINNEMIVLDGDGSQIRDFIHINDVCRAIELCIEYGQPYSEPVDIGTGKGTSIAQLAKMFNHKFTFAPESDMIGTNKSIADIKAAEVLWNFKSKYKLEDYMKGV
jgi:UDP-glucose 4-epimerase